MHGIAYLEIMKNKFIRQARLPHDAYAKDLEDVLGSYMGSDTEKKKVLCKTHPTGKWLINPMTKTYYLKCSRGFKTNEICVRGGEIEK